MGEPTFCAGIFVQAFLYGHFWLAFCTGIFVRKNSYLLDSAYGSTCSFFSFKAVQTHEGRQRCGLIVVLINC